MAVIIGDATRYLKDTLNEVLARALHEVCQARPLDPIEFLAKCLYKAVDCEIYYQEKAVFEKEMQLMANHMKREEKIRQRAISRHKKHIQDMKRIANNIRRSSIPSRVSRQDSMRQRQPFQIGFTDPATTGVIPKTFPRSAVHTVRRSSFHTTERRSTVSVHYSDSTSREIADDTLLERSSSIHTSRSETISPQGSEHSDALNRRINWWETRHKSKGTDQKAPTQSDSGVRRAMAKAFRATQKAISNRAKKVAKQNKKKKHRGDDHSSQGTDADESTFIGSRKINDPKISRRESERQTVDAKESDDYEPDDSEFDQQTGEKKKSIAERGSETDVGDHSSSILSTEEDGRLGKRSKKRGNKLEFSTDSENEESAKKYNFSPRRSRSKKTKEPIIFEDIQEGESKEEKAKKKRESYKRGTQFRKMTDAVDSAIIGRHGRRGTRRGKSHLKDDDGKWDSAESRQSVTSPSDTSLDSLLNDRPDGKAKHKRGEREVGRSVSSLEKLRKRHRKQKTDESVESLDQIPRHKRRGLKKGHAEDDAEDDDRGSSTRYDGIDSSSMDVIGQGRKKTFKLGKKKPSKKDYRTRPTISTESDSHSLKLSTRSSQSGMSSVSSEVLDSSLVATVENETESYSTITPVECYWVLQAKRALVCVHPVLGELRAHPVSSDKPDYIGWPVRSGYTWQAFYDPELYTIVNPYIDDTKYSSRIGQTF